MKISIAPDILDHQALIDLSIEFVAGRENLRYLKLTKKEPLIGCVMPVVELISAAGAYPVYPMRMLPFGNSALLKSLDLGKTLFGNNFFGKIVKNIAKIDRKGMLGNIVEDLIDGIFARFDEMYHYGVDNGVPADECYGIKVVSGAYFKKGKNLDGSFLTSIRCSAFQKAYETWAFTTPTIFVDVPPDPSEEGLKTAINEVRRAAKQIEDITGKKITQESLRKVAKETNRCKDYAEELIKLAVNDKYVIAPVTFSKLLGLIEIAFQDYLSNPKRFGDILGNIVHEMKQQLREGKGLVDVSNMPKILFTSRFGGWDSIVGDYLQEEGGRVVYADWFIYGFMDRISLEGDMFENYAKYLMANNLGFAPTNKEIVNRIVDFTLKYNFDGVIYNQLFGCHSLSTVYPRLRKALLHEEIPSTMVSFNNVGENREQLKTRVVALMELIKQ